MADKAIEVLLDEKRNFPPPKEFKKSANIKSAACSTPRAKIRKPSGPKRPKNCTGSSRGKKSWSGTRRGQSGSSAASSTPPTIASIATCKVGRKNKAAIIWEGEPGDERVLTYRDVWREVNKFANVLKKLGVKKGDRVCLYMGMIPELVIAMHACNRIGAPHSVVFGGFSAEALRGRINDAQAKVLVTADGGYRRGAVVPLKKECRRSAYRHAVDRACCRGKTGRRRLRRADERRPRSVVG